MAKVPDKIYDQLDLTACNLCPRQCGTNRLLYPGDYCKTDRRLYIASIFNHTGEEPPIKGRWGICNVFFAHCNLQCVYCQNWDISRNIIPAENFLMSLDLAVEEIIWYLNRGIPAVGFVSPSHAVAQMVQIIEELHRRGYHPIIVYNTNAYDRVEILQQISPLIDVYLPDLKYMDNKLARKYSKASDYVEVATAAIKEMFRQKGDKVLINHDGYAYSGLIIRHLILPNNVENSIKVMDFIRNELSKNVHISLLSQYHPANYAYKYPELNRPITFEEYKAVTDYMKKIGLTKGWWQGYFGF